MSSKKSGASIDNYHWGEGLNDYSLKDVIPEEFAQSMISLEGEYVSTNRPSPLSNHGFKQIASTEEGKESYIRNFLNSGLLDESMSLEERIDLGHTLYNSISAGSEGEGALFGNEAYGANSPNTNLKVLPELTPWVIVGMDVKKIAGEMFTKYQDEKTNKQLVFFIQYDKEYILDENVPEGIPFTAAQRDGTLNELVSYSLPLYKPIVSIDSSDTKSTMPASNSNVKYPFIGRRSVTDDGYIVLDRAGASRFNFFDACGVDPKISSMTRNVKLTKVLYTKKKTSPGDYTLGDTLEATSNEGSATVTSEVMTVNLTPQYSAGGGPHHTEATITLSGPIRIAVTDDAAGVKTFEIGVKVDLNSGVVTTMIESGGTDYIKAIYLRCEKENIANDEVPIEVSFDTKTQSFSISERRTLGLNIVPQAVTAHDAENKVSFYTKYISKITEVAAAMKDGHMLEKLDEAFTLDPNNFFISPRTKGFKSDNNEFNVTSFIKSQNTTNEFFTNGVKDGLRYLIETEMIQAQTDTLFAFNDGVWKFIGHTLDTRFLVEQDYSSGSGTGPASQPDESGNYKNGFSVPTRQYTADINNNKIVILSSMDKKYKNRGLIGQFVSTKVKESPTAVYIPHTMQMYEAISTTMRGRMMLHLWTRDLIDIFGCLLMRVRITGNDKTLYEDMSKK